MCKFFGGLITTKNLTLCSREITKKFFRRNFHKKFHFWPYGFDYLGFFKNARRALCFQMDFTRTFEANAKGNNINHVWSQYYKFLVVLKYHRRPTLKWCIWHILGYLCSYRCLCQRYWLKGVYGTSKLLKFHRNDFKTWFILLHLVA